MVKLNEGMRAGDLEDMLLPMITVDEYESKLDSDNIVVGFYVGDKDAANDLNRFIQKSPIQIMDNEVSPAPDQHGYYLVFMEFINDRRIVENIAGILEEVSPLCGIEKWQMRLRDSDGVMPFSTKVLTDRFAEMRNDLQNDDEKESPKDNDKLSETQCLIMEFLTKSDLEDAQIEGNELTIFGQHTSFTGKIVGLSEVEHLIDQHNLVESAISLDLESAAHALKITRMLGEGWLYSQLGDYVLLQRADCDEALLLSSSKFY